MSLQNGSANKNGFIVHMDGGINGGLPSLSKGQLQKYPANKSKTFIALALFLVACVANDFALAWIHERVPMDAEPLPDLWFSIFPECTEAIKIAEAMIMITIVTGFAVLLLHEHRWIVVRRVFLIAAVVYLGRAICITVTQVPVPSKKTYCGPKVNKSSLNLVVQRVWWIVSGLGMEIYHKRVLCGDLIYSGHTVTLVLSALAINQYLPRGPRKFRLIGWAAWVFALSGMVCILMARKHYTIDIILAYYVTTRVFWIYHGLVERKGSVRRASANAASLTSVFYYPIFQYFESDVPAVIPNNFKL